MKSIIRVCGSVLLTVFVLTNAVFAGTIQLPETGQTQSFAVGDDGALRKGVEWPSPRFTDNSDGTVTDNLTGLTWLKNANCFGPQAWSTALANTNGLASGACGLADGSKSGDWRLANIEQLESLVDISNYTMSLPSGHPFSNVQASPYWSSTTYAGDSNKAWSVYMWGGGVYKYDKSYSIYAWPVRGGQQYWVLDHLVVSAKPDTDFGAVNVGDSGTVQELTLHNNGNVSLTVTSMATSGANSTEFGIAIGGSHPCASKSPTIAAGASCTLLASFLPISIGTKNASLTVSANSKSIVIPLSGRGVSTIMGTVTDLSTGNPLAGATVSITGGTATQSDPSGNFYFDPPPSKGVYTLTIIKNGYGAVAFNNVGFDDTSGVNMKVAMTPPGTLAITTPPPTLPAATIGTVYNTRINITGGTGPFTYSIPSGTGSLPPGLTLDPVLGEISGIPTTAGTFAFSVNVSDSLISAEFDYTVNVADPLVITTSATLPRGTSNAPYSTSIVTTGGTGSYVFSVRGSPTHYYDYNNSSVTWNQAKASCEAKGEHLVTITSSAENTSVINLAKANGGAMTWIGLSKIGGIWKWVTGEPVTYTFWGGLNNSGFCGQLWPSNNTLTWDDTDCNLLHAYICENEGSYAAPGIFLQANGLLSGTPTSTGATQFTVIATDSESRTVKKDFTINVDGAFANTTFRLNDGITGTTFNQILSATGGLPPFTWGVYSGSLPAGLTLDTTTGVISGTPTIAGSKVLVISVRDSYNRIVFKEYTFNVVKPLQILTNSMPNGFVNDPYSDQIRLDGGNPPFNFTYTGALPTGLALNPSTGIISGTPTQSGLIPVTITVTDSTWPTAQTRTQGLSIRVWSQLTITSGAVLANARKDSAITPVNLVAKGGTVGSGYNWSIVGGALPAGIIMSSSGIISGAPTMAGEYIATVRVTDQASTPATYDKQFFIHVSDTLVVTSGAVPDGAVGSPYSYTLTASGGLKNYSWAIVTGTLPAGLTLNSSGTISGNPVAKITSNLTVEVTDSDAPAQKARKSYVFDISDTLSIYDRTLQGGRVNSAYTASVRAQLGTAPYTWRVKSGTLPTGTTLTQNAGVATISGTPTAGGTYTFELEVSDNGTPVQRVSRIFTVQIVPQLAVSTTSLKAALRSVPYAESIAVTGGLLPYSFSLATGSLPAGLTLNSTSGTISGTITLPAGQSSTFTVRVSDSGSPPAYVDRPLSIFAIDPLTITSTSIPGALQKSSYGPINLAASGGRSPLTWTLANATTLPQGIVLSSTGILSGTSVVCGSFPFTVQVADSAPIATTAQQAYPLSVTCANDYVISGSVGTHGAGATITLGASSSQTTTADADGNYRFLHLLNGSYTVTPQLTQKIFSPLTRSVTVNSTDVGGANFSIPAYLLSVTLSGTGSGSVNSSPAGIACYGSTCPSAAYDAGTSVALTETPNTISTFGGWTGACTSTPCNVTMNASKSVTATFTAAPLAWNASTSTPYPTLAAALTAAISNNEIWTLDTQLDGAVILIKALILKGGWNATYSGRSGQPTLLNGDLTIQNGNSSVETIDVKGKLTVQNGSLLVNGVDVR